MSGDASRPDDEDARRRRFSRIVVIGFIAALLITIVVSYLSMQAAYSGG